MGMTKEQKRQQALETLGIASAAEAKAAYRKEVLTCHPDKLQYPEGATDDVKKQVLTQAQARFVALTEAYKILIGEIELTDDEELDAPTDIATAQQKSAFWNKPLTFDADIAEELQKLFTALFLTPLWTENLPHVHSVGYTMENTIGTRGATTSFSSQVQLAKFCAAGLKDVSGKLTLSPLNFPREWLGTVYDALAENKQLTEINFPEGYEFAPNEAKKWQALIVKKEAPAVAGQVVENILRQNRFPLIGGAVTTVFLAAMFGGLFFPLVAGVGAVFAGREIEKRLKQSREYYSENKVKTLEGQPEGEAYHLGEAAAKGFTPFANSLMDPKLRQAPSAYVAGLQHALIPDEKRVAKKLS